MNVSYDEQIRRSPELLSLAEQATPQLEAVVGPSHAEAQAEWGYEEEAGHKWATLQIRDAPEEVRTRLAPEELRETSRVRKRLRWLWGDLLQARLNRLVQGLLEDVGANGDG